MPENFDFNKIEKYNNEFFNNFCLAIRGGNSKAYYKLRAENVILSDDWITVIESALFSVEKICTNPRKFIVGEEIVVDVERAKKTDGKTVRHLSQHSQYVRNIEKDGEVRPKKLLVTEINEDLAIYENRLVCTLINRLILFCEQQYREINKKAICFDRSTINYTSDFKYGKSVFECSLAITAIEPTKNYELAEANAAILERVKMLQKRLRALQLTQFYKVLNDKKPVRAPIVKTNLLRSNVDYSNCYKLWLYLSSYRLIGYTEQSQEKDLPIEGDYYDDLTAVVSLGVQSLVRNGIINESQYKKIDFKPLKEKKLKIRSNLLSELDFASDKKSVGEDTINEYYFKKMRDELMRASKRGEIEEEREIKMTFQRFFRNISNINDEMYKDVINSHLPDIDMRKSPIERKKQAIARQKLVLRRYAQLSKLRREELEKTLNKESRETLKLEKLQLELDKERKKRIDKQARDKAKKEKLRKLKAKKLLAEKNAADYRQTLKDREQARIDANEEKKRLKREEAQRQRELRKLKQLQEKYSDGQDTQN